MKPGVWIADNNNKAGFPKENIGKVGQTEEGWENQKQGTWILVLCI